MCDVLFVGVVRVIIVMFHVLSLVVGCWLFAFVVRCVLFIVG